MESSRKSYSDSDHISNCASISENIYSSSSSGASADPGQLGDDHDGFDDGPDQFNGDTDPVDEINAHQKLMSFQSNSEPPQASTSNPGLTPQQENAGIAIEYSGSRPDESDSSTKPDAEAGGRQIQELQTANFDLNTLPLPNSLSKSPGSILESTFSDSRCCDISKVCEKCMPRIVAEASATKEHDTVPCRVNGSSSASAESSSNILSSSKILGRGESEVIALPRFDGKRSNPDNDLERASKKCEPGGESITAGPVPPDGDSSKATSVSTNSEQGNNVATVREFDPKIDHQVLENRTLVQQPDTTNHQQSIYQLMQLNGEQLYQLLKSNPQLVAALTKVQQSPAEGHMSDTPNALSTDELQQDVPAASSTPVENPVFDEAPNLSGDTFHFNMERTNKELFNFGSNSLLSSHAVSSAQKSIIAGSSLGTPSNGIQIETEAPCFSFGFPIPSTPRDTTSAQASSIFGSSRVSPSTQLSSIFGSITAVTTSNSAVLEMKKPQFQSAWLPRPWPTTSAQAPRRSPTTSSWAPTSAQALSTPATTSISATVPTQGPGGFGSAGFNGMEFKPVAEENNASKSLMEELRLDYYNAGEIGQQGAVRGESAVRSSTDGRSQGYGQRIFELLERERIERIEDSRILRCQINRMVQEQRSLGRAIGNLTAKVLAIQLVSNRIEYYVDTQRGYEDQRRPQYTISRPTPNFEGFTDIPSGNTTATATNSDSDMRNTSQSQTQPLADGSVQTRAPSVSGAGAVVTACARRPQKCTSGSPANMGSSAKDDRSSEAIGSPPAGDGSITSLKDLTSEVDRIHHCLGTLLNKFPRENDLTYGAFISNGSEPAFEHHVLELMRVKEKLAVVVEGFENNEEIIFGLPQGARCLPTERSSISNEMMRTKVGMWLLSMHKRGH